MDAFPLKALKPRHAILSGEPDCASLDILLAPFLWDGQIVDTSIRLDGIGLPSVHLADLAGKSFAFPCNPEEGYIDGSIYLGSRHHPVDVTALSFPRARDGGLSVVVKGTYLFDPWCEWLAELRHAPLAFGVRVSSGAV